MRQLEKLINYLDLKIMTRVWSMESTESTINKSKCNQDAAIAGQISCEDVIIPIQIEPCNCNIGSRASLNDFRSSSSPIILHEPSSLPSEKNIISSLYAHKSASLLIHSTPPGNRFVTVDPAVIDQQEERNNLLGNNIQIQSSCDSNHLTTKKNTLQWKYNHSMWSCLLSFGTYIVSKLFRSWRYGRYNTGLIVQRTSSLNVDYNQLILIGSSLRAISTSFEKHKIRTQKNAN